MEQIEIHSRSYLLRWVHAKSNFTISWTVQPHKRSINLGLFKHPGALASLPTVGGLPPLSATSSRTEDGGEDGQPEVADKLANIGLKQVMKLGKCEPDRPNPGKYDVPNGGGGHYALVFDNTFSKSTGKVVTFFLLTYPTNAQYQISFGAQVHHSQALTNAIPLAPAITSNKSPRLGAKDKQSVDSLKLAAEVGPLTPGLATSRQAGGQDSGLGYSGILQKRRRKKHQGYAKRFYSLNYSSGTLSYYHDRNSSLLRGAIPLSLAAIGANAKTREISIDSGAEIWHLKANNAADFDGWKNALEKASAILLQNEQVPELEIDTTHLSPGFDADDQSWERLESLLSKISGTRDAVRRLCTTTLNSHTLPASPFSDVHTPTSSDREGGDYFPEERRAFWKRKPSGTENNRNIFKRSTSAQLAVPPSGSTGPSSPSFAPEAHKGPKVNSMQDHMRDILNNLDAVIAEFHNLISATKQRRPSPQTVVSRLSMQSMESQEFFDAEDRALTRSDTQFLDIQSDGSDNVSDKGSDDSETSSDVEENHTLTGRGFRSDSLSSLVPPKAKNLAPLPLEPVKRRVNVKAPTIMPPSLIGFLRKNVGKDLSTISMPVSANEPISLLQKAAENLEYSELLDKAASLRDSAERLLYVTAFALSAFSNARVKERNIRKPFNPMLGETYELIREDKNFRFASEKVSHRPVQLAFHAEGKDWSFSQSPSPSQKFWGKSSEIITEGKARIVLYSAGECFSWVPATSFLRNIIAGEKYVEPVGSMTILNETTGWKCIVTFKAKGMFSGRSEEVDVQMMDNNSMEQPLGLAGTWTTSLSIKENGRADPQREVWHTGSLVDKPEKHYGMTQFAAELNEITHIEQGHLPPTDSRLRADQKALENGQYEEAENLKTAIEEGQRARRRELEGNGEEWTPKFFMKVTDGDETVWKLKVGTEGYWERRAKKDWHGIVDVLKPNDHEPGLF